MKYPLITDWDGQSWCKFSICWPDSVQWRGLLRGLITLPARGRTWDERTGLITSMTDIGKQIRDENLELEHCIMSCNEAESLAAAIVYLADKLASRTGGDNCDTGNTNICGGGTGGAGNTEGPPTSQVSDTANQVPPDGFADWAEYEVYKCGVATLIVNQAKSDTENAQLINWVGVVLSSALPAFIALLVSPMPGDEIMFIVGLCIAAIALGIPIFTGANAALSNGLQDYICALFTADNVGQAISNWESVTEDQITLQGLDPAVAYYVRAWLNSFANNDNFNRLFEKDTSINYPAGDCSECVPPCETWQGLVIFGDEVSRSVDGEAHLHITIDSQDTAFGSSVSLQLPDGNNCCFQVVDWSHNGELPNVNIARFCNGTNVNLPPGATLDFLLSGQCLRTISTIGQGFSHTPFTLTLELELCTTPT